MHRKFLIVDEIFNAKSKYGDDEHGVVPGDAAQDPGQHGVVDGAGQQLGRAGGGAQHELLPGPLGRDEQVRAPARQARRRVLGQGDNLNNTSTAAWPKPLSADSNSSMTEAVRAFFSQGGAC